MKILSSQITLRIPPLRDKMNGRYDLFRGPFLNGLNETCRGHEILKFLPLKAVAIRILKYFKDQKHLDIFEIV